MVVVVHDYGTHVSKRSNCICIQTKNAVSEFCADQVTELHLYPASTISTDAVKLCMEKDISVIYMNYNGSPLGEIQAFSGGCSPIYKRKQLSLASSRKGIEITKSLLAAKLQNRIHFLKQIRHNKRKQETIFILDHAIQKMETELAKIQQCTGNCISDVRLSLQGYEGAAGRAYFEAVACLLPPEIAFIQRSRSAEDVYNNALNYLNGILYAKIKDAVYQCRLDPYIGIMHVDSYNKPTFVFDLIEGQRYISEELSFQLCSKQIVTAADMEMAPEGRMRFSKEGRQKLISAFYERMEKKCCWKKKRITQWKKLQLSILEIAKQISEEETDVLPAV